MTSRSLSFLVLAGLLAGLTPAVAADLGEKQALAKAVAILKGDPYGDTDAEVAAHITERRHTTRAATVCGGGATPVWAFRVVIEKPKNNEDSRIDGWIVVDARTGRLVCAGLPFLD